MPSPPPIRASSRSTDASIDVAQGEIVVVAGANGAGKSTLAEVDRRAWRSRVPASVTFAGERIDGLAGHLVTARGVAYVPENRRLFPRLSVADNLRLGSYLFRGKADREAPIERVFTLFPRLQRAAASSAPRPFRAASSRCSPSAAP